MESRRSLSRVNIRCSPLILLFLLLTHNAWGQRVPLVLGEMGITIKNSQTPLYVTAVASGNVGGSRSSWYALTHDSLPTRAGVDLFLVWLFWPLAPGPWTLRGLLLLFSSLK